MKAYIRHWKDGELILKLIAETDCDRRDLMKFAVDGHDNGFSFNGSGDGCGKSTIWLVPIKID